MKSKIIFFIVCFSFFNLAVYAQIKIEGNVKDSLSGNNIAFANVFLQLQSDTTKNYSGALTDLEGNFSFENIPSKPYRIVISYLGYKSVTENIVLSGSSEQNNITKNYFLQSLATELGETVVTANRNIQHIDHRAITFTNEQIKRAQVGRDLIKDIPEIKEDALTGTLTQLSDLYILLVANQLVTHSTFSLVYYRFSIFS